MKKYFCALIALLMLVQSCATCASEEFSVEAKAAVLIDAISGRVLFAHNADEMLPMASTTKIMTALLALEKTSLTETVTASKRASGVMGTSIYLHEGEALTMEQMLYGLMIRSGNDAAVAIAEHIAGSSAAFADMMNARAAALAADANFVNPHGLDANGHAASALGMAYIMRAAMRNEDFRTIASTQQKVIPWIGNEFSRVLNNKNKLLKTYEGATAGKTGFTSKAGRCLVFSAEREGMELIGVVLNCPGWFNEAAKLLDYGFENYAMQTALSAGDVACEIAVSGGMTDKVIAVAATDLAAAIGNDERWQVDYDFGDGLRAPIQQGAAIGTATLTANGEVVASCSLVASKAVAEKTILSALRRIILRWVLAFQE